VSYTVCSACKVTLRCVKNEKVVRFGGAEIKWGDEYQCPGCGIKVILGFGGPVMPGHPDYKVFENEVEVEASYY
jgi:hypothetical protein